MLSVSNWQAIDGLTLESSLPQNLRTPLGLIGCGTITAEHLKAYRNANLNVVALCDRHREKAEERRQAFFPAANVYSDYRALLRDDRVEVVDIATHPSDRVELIRESLLARKHVLSQKPFVLDLDVGQSLIELSYRQNVLLAVNQNGRYAPHFHWMRRAIAAGLLGETFAAHLRVHWDHTWTRGTRFESIRHLILYDFGIHWFDMLACLLPNQSPLRVFATTARAPRQNMKPPLLAQALIEYPHAQASLVFDAALTGEPLDESLVIGTRASALSTGPSLLDQNVTLRLPHAQIQPRLKGSWFPDAFGGTMIELLSSLVEGRRCEILAEDNLASLALCFAAVASADGGQPIAPGSVRSIQL